MEPRDLMRGPYDTNHLPLEPVAVLSSDHQDTSLLRDQRVSESRIIEPNAFCQESTVMPFNGYTDERKITATVPSESVISTSFGSSSRSNMESDHQVNRRSCMNSNQFDSRNKDVLVGPDLFALLDGKGVDEEYDEEFDDIDVVGQIS